MEQMKIARVEELIEALRDGDTSRLRRGWPAYIAWCDALDDYSADGSFDNWQAFLKATADLIEEAMEGNF